MAHVNRVCQCIVLSTKETNLTESWHPPGIDELVLVPAAPPPVPPPDPPQVPPHWHYPVRDRWLPDRFGSCGSSFHWKGACVTEPPCCVSVLVSSIVYCHYCAWLVTCYDVMRIFMHAQFVKTLCWIMCSLHCVPLSSASTYKRGRKEESITKEPEKLNTAHLYFSLSWPLEECVRYRLSSFSLMRSTITTIRGSRTVRLHCQSTQQIELVAAEGHIPSARNIL